MHTACPLSYRGLPNRQPLPGQNPLDRDPPGHVTCDACWDRDSTVWTEWLTDRCKNITFANVEALIFFQIWEKENNDVLHTLTLQSDI